MIYVILIDLHSTLYLSVPNAIKPKLKHIRKCFYTPGNNAPYTVCYLVFSTMNEVYTQEACGLLDCTVEQ